MVKQILKTKARVRARTYWKKRKNGVVQIQRLELKKYIGKEVLVTISLSEKKNNSVKKRKKR